MAEDHENAQRLARALAEVPGLEIDPAAVRTNIVVATVRASFFEGGGKDEAEAALVRAGKLAEALFLRLKEVGVLGMVVGHDRYRMITHRDLPADDVDEAIERLRRLLL